VKILKLFFKNKKSIGGIIILTFFVVIAIFAPFIAPYSPKDMAFLPLQLPNSNNILGTTAMGEDIFSQVVWGTRQSLIVSLLTGSIATLISVIIGFSAGYFGGIVDEILMTITNVFLVIPGFPLIIILSAFLPIKGMWIIIFVISITGWAWGARTLRSQVLSLKSRDFIKAAIVIGENSFHIIFVEIFPNLLSLVAANFLGATVYALLSESGLQFLGLGDVRAVSWGTILYWAQNNQALHFGLWTWVLVPGICIALLGMALSLINFAIDEITNPRLRR